MKIHEIIVKLQNLTDQQKKIIIIVIVLILAFIFGFFWIRSATERLNKLGEATKDIKLSEIDLPKLELPDNQIKNTEIEDWQNLKFSSYGGFEIKYPGDWTHRIYDSGIALQPNNKFEIGYEPINIGFYERGSDYCSIPFDEYVKKAGIYEIQDFDSLNEFKELKTIDGFKIYQAKWNILSAGEGENIKISLPITYFGINNENLCGGFEAFLNNEEFIDIYNKIISTFRFTK
ncbi:MAG: hypothetical protein A2312_04430 [Candidatus Staskawiczbacteria bacterium RIFOXYB2_FULL_32_9]|nr:MAG: hypothetical protein UR22_C0009G0002 [Parcubacteria group bacterium GW2011_GWC2_32_10]OGZ81869.1 MAG: hypothetical protein A2312_04430 [Candidatus Staskawiczbacteria bacterium RIFOXYB2_FULL_32_9]